MQTDPVTPRSSTEPAPSRGAHTATFPELLERLGISLLVTTYQNGNLVLLRSNNGVLDTHFRQFAKPMGLALRGGRLAIGTNTAIWEFHNVSCLAPGGGRDDCFLPRICHITGDIRIHEMAWGDDELWFVNTRFSCLCTRDGSHSFLPRWRPSFVTALAPEDRCHLNGIGMAAGRPRLATALGMTDSRDGWRVNKKNGGILIDVENNEVLLSGLSMPHSPRWHEGQIWLLESGTGTIGTVDSESRAYRPMTELPGFTRGLDFHGRYAFVGLSKVRETAFFSNIPITESPAERQCGVWAVDLLTGTIVAYVRFEDEVQEVFAVQVVPFTRLPDLINPEDAQIADSFVLSDTTLAAVPSTLWSRAGQK